MNSLDTIWLRVQNCSDIWNWDMCECLGFVQLIQQYWKHWISNSKTESVATWTNHFKLQLLMHSILQKVKGLKNHETSKSLKKCPDRTTYQSIFGSFLKVLPNESYDFGLLLHAYKSGRVWLSFNLE